MPLKVKKGLATLSPQRREEIASMGGKRAQELGTAHKWTSEEARIAGRKGGLNGKGKHRRGSLNDFIQEN